MSSLSKAELHVTNDKGGFVFTGQAKEILGDAIEWLRDPAVFTNWELAALVSQLVEEGLAAPLGGQVLLGWEELFELLSSPDHSGVKTLLALPPICDLTPALVARGSIADPYFEVNLEWRDSAGRAVGANVTRCGALVTVAGNQYMLDVNAWRLSEEVLAFHSRKERTQTAQEKAWARLRQLARNAGAVLDHYLERTVILTAAKLDLSLRRAQTNDTLVVEVIPRVKEAPEDLWLEAFDRYSQVQKHYDLSTADGGRIRVLVEPDARAVLAEIKRMPGRRIAGERAEAFLRNPYALLGEAMATVVAPEDFEKARDDAGVLFYDFNCEALRETDGRIRALRIRLLPRDEDAPALPVLEIADRILSKAFTDSLEKALTANASCFRWGKQTLELRGDSLDQLRQVRAWLCAAWTGEPIIKWEGLLDLSQYAERVEGIGAHRPQYVPYLASREGQHGWLPENLEPILSYQAPNGETVSFPVCPEQIEEIKNWLSIGPATAEQFTPSGWPAPVDRKEAERLLGAFDQGRIKPVVPPSQEAGTSVVDTPHPTERPTILIKQNVLQVDYSEDRAEKLTFHAESCTAKLPTWLRPDPGLYEHQRVGLAWLQHLWKHRVPQGVRGAILADDMGLGKTLQLLSFIAWYLEMAGDAALPALVVAPVSLLEIWQGEIARFFDERLGKHVLSLYGKALRDRKFNRKDIGELIEHGVRDLLMPGWRNDKKLVLTTYETLRDLEIGLARELWSVMVCDEAQKVKTPGALMTHAAKAQNALFRIACTGTPVENSLADLWCLFDFVQPGLLGSLAEFCRTYRRPIETRTDQERQRLEELRLIIEPQVLRRLKDDVVDLPPKQIQDDGKLLPVSHYQRQLYSQAAAESRYKSKNNTDTGVGSGNIVLGLLHRLRSICADPHEPGTVPDLKMQITKHCERSPKLDWLLRRLDAIRQKNEKVIVFTEFRDLQRVLQCRIRERFGFSPAIVNGSTKTGQDAGEHTRQRLIDSFQARHGFNIIILSTTAIGFGVNIQKANHVIHFTRAWNPAKEDQATDRTHRIGQTLPVNVYYPTVTAEDFETFEVKLDALLQRKRDLARDMLNGAGEIELGEWAELDAPGGEKAIPRIRLWDDRLARLTPAAFERLCQVRLLREGYKAHLTKHSGDCGVDVIAILEGKGLLVQCKSSTRERALGWEAVRDVVAGADSYSRQYPGVTFELVAATNQTFNTNAMAQAQQHKVQLWQTDDWAEWLANHDVYLDELTK